MKAAISIVTTSQPSANPRMLKEAIALQASGYRVTVIYCPLSPWADEFDKAVFKKYPQIVWVKAGYHPVKEWKKYQFARVRRKFYQFVYRIVGNVFDVPIQSFALYSQELCNKAMSVKADFYIGHNIGAMPVVVKAAEMFGVKAGFDFEDFHRGEDAEGSVHWKKIIAIENKYVPKLDYTTTAAPLISFAYQRLYPEKTFQTINNCFPLSYGVDVLQTLPHQPLRLFWFSQFIGQKRGLETVIEAIGRTGDATIELSLLGNCSTERRRYFESVAKQHGLKDFQLHFLDPVSESEIVQIASQYHIGLATEVPHILNRELCLTNKIFMYLLAGNAIVFSKTQAQADFLRSFPEVGSMYEQGDARQLAALLNSYIEQPALLEQQRTASLALGKTKLNWEAEQQGLLEHVKRAI